MAKAEQAKDSRNTVMPLTVQTFLFLLGLFISSWGFTAFIIGNNIITGGLPGLAALLFRQFGLSLSITLWGIGLVIIFFGWLFMGGKETLRSLSGALLLPATIAFTKTLGPIQCNEPILAALFGGALIGIGLGFVFKGNFNVGGFSVIARILAKKADMPMHTSMLIMDACVILSSAYLFGADAAMLALISIIAISKSIDLVQSGLSSAKSVSIITQRPEEIKEVILGKLDSGATQLVVEGGYSAKPSAMIVTVIPKSKVARLKRNVKAIDPHAFTIISEASEVLGYGFKNHN